MADQIRFTETMTGWFSPFAGQSYEQADATGKRERTGGYFVLTMLTPDVQAMTLDPNRRSPLYGCMVLPAVDPAPLRVLDGHLDLFVDAAPNVVHMRYALVMQAAGGATYFLRGVKEVVRQSWFPTVSRDTTTLFVDIYAGSSPEGAPIHRGIVRMGPGAVIAQGLSFRGEGGLLGIGAIWRFMRYYIGRVCTVYFGPRGRGIRE